MSQNSPEHIVVLTGAGISAESGLKTFRDSGGLWEGQRVEDVATPDAWRTNPALVLQFYNDRRIAMRAAQPNAAHFALVNLERMFRVSIITQNVDDLHERAGSSSILHLHGELNLARSTEDENILIPVGDRIELGDTCPHGSQLRPHIVWFGEPVPLLEQAIKITETADTLLVVGTSLAVYPAASLLNFTPQHCRRFLIDPGQHFENIEDDIAIIQAPASQGVPVIVDRLLSERGR